MPPLRVSWVMSHSGASELNMWSPYSLHLPAYLIVVGFGTWGLAEFLWSLAYHSLEGLLISRPFPPDAELSVPVQLEFTATVQHMSWLWWRGSIHTCVHSWDGTDVFCWCAHCGLHAGGGLPWTVFKAVWSLSCPRPVIAEGSGLSHISAWIPDYSSLLATPARPLVLIFSALKTSLN